MKPKPEEEPLAEPAMRALFAQQRRVDHEDAPAWRQECLRALPVKEHAPGRLRWLPMALGTACLALAAGLFMPASKPETRLSEALPPLLNETPGELFADMGPAFSALESPSDFLLPHRVSSHPYPSLP